jgi:pyruvate oxidase
MTDRRNRAQCCGGGGPGATGISVTRREELDGAMASLFAADGPATLCVEQDAELL